MLKVLILGGTVFLGPYLVKDLLDNGHQVTLFNRGTHTIQEIEGVKNLKGDRDGDLSALFEKEWDAVIDTSCHRPRQAMKAAEVLRGHVSHYTFISTIGVYDNFDQAGIDEIYPLSLLENEYEEEITEKNYGALKAAAEKIIESSFKGKSLIIRPGLIVGPGDPTDRFTYWPLRVKEGGNIIAPATPEREVQFIDVRDLSRWIVELVEKKQTGIFNATGRPIAFEQVLQECKEATNSDARIEWLSEDYLSQHQVQDWSELPLWLSTKRNMPGFFLVNSERAKKAGLTLRPLRETVHDIIIANAGRDSSTLKAGIDKNKENHLLSLWLEQQK